MTEMDFSSKKLIENPQKSKVTVSFEICNKKLIDEIYNKIIDITDADSVSVQELND